MAKVVSFVDDNDKQVGSCDITEAAYDTLSGGDTLVSFNGQLWGYYDANVDAVEMHPRWPHLLFSIGEPGAPAHVVPADPSGDVARLAAVSDLFFNYDHPNRDALVQAEAGGSRKLINEADYRAAVTADANDFINTFQIATGITLNVDDVVSDYLDRE